MLWTDLSLQSLAGFVSAVLGQTGVRCDTGSSGVL